MRFCARCDYNNCMAAWRSAEVDLCSQLLMWLTLWLLEWLVFLCHPGCCLLLFMQKLILKDKEFWCVYISMGGTFQATAGCQDPDHSESNNKQNRWLWDAFWVWILTFQNSNLRLVPPMHQFLCHVYMVGWKALFKTSAVSDGHRRLTIVKKKSSVWSIWKQK